jgi:hypothetical protein
MKQVNRKDGVYHLKILLLYKSNEKNCLIIIFRTLEISQSLAPIQGTFIPEKWLDPGKNTKLCVI